MPAVVRVPALLLLLTAAVGCGRDAPPQPPARNAAVVAGVNRAVAQMGQYDFSAAVATLEPLVAAHPADAGLAVNLALAHINRQSEGDAAAAERLLTAVTGDPAMGTRAQYALGLLQLYAGRDAEAAPLLAAAAAATPTDGYAAYFAGQARLATAPEDALGWFTKAQALDPHLRSAHYGAFQALQRLGRGSEAEAMLTRFQSLERDPRAQLAEFKYTRMGPLATAVTLDAPPEASQPGAVGSAFSEPSPPFPSRQSMPPGFGTWVPDTASLTVADLDGDGDVEIFLANAMAGRRPNAILHIDSSDSQVLDNEHPLSSVSGVRAAMWGDIDDDGLVDVVLLRRGGTAIWRQAPAGTWRDVTNAMRASTPDVDAVDGALFDADHDGDLDVWLVNGGGPNELLNNNGDATFRRIAAQAGLAGDRRPSRGVAVADLDGDRDHDLIVLKAAPPHQVFLNDRVWQYRPAAGMGAFAAADIDAVVSADADANGQVELYTTGPRGVERWQPDGTGTWQPATIARSDGTTRGAQLAVADVNGDGGLEILASRGVGWAAWPAAATEPLAQPLFDASSVAVSAWTIANLEPVRGNPVSGPSVVGVGPDGPIDWRPSRRPNYLALSLSGREIASDQRRSNSSGIGTRLAVRRGSHWTALDTVRMASGPGQSLQPVTVGLGGADRADFVSLIWSDGILQTEIDLEAGRLHRIEETQRQLSSCPVLFTWDGAGFRFVTDILGVGGIGFLERPGVYSPPHPHERVLLPDAALAARDGRYQLVLGEPMEEVAYLDHAELAVYDLPPGWQMTLDERKAIAGPVPTGAPIFYRHERLPTLVVNDRGEDVTSAVATADRRAAPPGAIDPRFIGRTAAHAVTLEFDAPIDQGPGRPVLMVDGWVEYPYAQTVFAAWQTAAPYQAPTLEARDTQGRWHVVAPEFGYPAGMPRQMTLPMPHLPRGTVALRLHTTQEIYWDRLSVIYSEAAPAVVAHRIAPAAATVRAGGFARRTTGPQRTPHYDYGNRVPLLDTRHPRGWYSQFGAATPLVEAEDDAVAIIGPGEEVLLEFAALTTAVPAGWTRRMVLDAKGWCKDMDLYTKDGETVAPLPGEDSAARRRLHAQFNTRYQGGR
jgi:tetratricopeptide (TPR) repeat protein